MGLSKTKEKDFAKSLFINEKISIKEIADRVGVNEKTVAKWAKLEKWEDMRVSLVTVKSEQLSKLYLQLQKLNEHIATTKNNIPSAGDVDTISKLTSSINRLEVDSSIGEIISIGKDFISFMEKVEYPDTKKVAVVYNSFIQSRLK